MRADDCRYSSSGMGFGLRKDDDVGDGRRDGVADEDEEEEETQKLKYKSPNQHFCFVLSMWTGYLCHCPCVTARLINTARRREWMC